MKKTIIIILTILSLCPYIGKGQNTVQLRGTVHDRDDRALYVRRSFDNDRYIYPQYIIPITDGQFEYDLKFDEIVEYELIFLEEYESASWYPIRFFPDAPVIEFELYPVPERGEKINNKVTGGEINRMQKFTEELEEEIFGRDKDELYAALNYLYENRLFDTPQMEALYDQLDDADADQRLELFAKIDEMRTTKRGQTPQAVVLTDRLDSLNRVINSWLFARFIEEPSLYAYSTLISKLFFGDSPDNMNDIISLYEVLKEKYPEHSYTRMAGNLISAQRIVPGAGFVDFTAPDPEGTMFTLSEQVEGKIALIDLWASWCGSCRTKSMQVKPLYDRFRDKGFTVVGVAREYKDLSAFRTALAQDGYQWLNLVELDDQNGIWEKYGVANAGGRTVLVDENGLVVYVNPSTAQIEEYLTERLGGD